MTQTFDLLISTGTFYPDIGGPATYLKQLADALKAEDKKIKILSFGKKKEELNYPVSYISRRLPTIVRILLYTLRLLRNVSKAKSWYVNDYGFPAWIVSKLTRKKLIEFIFSTYIIPQPTIVHKTTPFFICCPLRFTTQIEISATDGVVFLIILVNAIFLS